MNPPASILSGYIRLAKEILARGTREHDTAFLKSEWAEYLRDTVAEFEFKGTAACNMCTTHAVYIGG